MIKPLGNRVLIDVIPPQRYEGNILFPGDWNDIPEIHTGIVVALGTKCKNNIKVGDRVVFEGVYGREVDKEDKQRVIDVAKLLAVETV